MPDGERFHHGVGDLDHQAVVQFATEREAEVDRSDEQLGRDVDIRVRPQIAALDAPLHDARHFIAAGLHDRRPERVAEPGIGRDLGEERSRDGPERRVADRAERVVRTARQLRARVTRVDDRDVGRREFGEQLACQGLLGRPAPVDRRLPDPRPCRDVLEAEAREAVLNELGAGCVEDRPVRLLAAWAAAGPAPMDRASASACWPSTAKQQGWPRLSDVRRATGTGSRTISHDDHVVRREPVVAQGVPLRRRSTRPEGNGQTAVG